MSRTPRPALAQARADLSQRLAARWPEIEQAAMARLYGVATPSGSPDPEYVEGLRSAASAALEYLLAGIGREQSHLPEVPAEVLVQARRAARCGVPLDTVLRRCFAGYTLFGDFLMQEAEHGGLLQSAAMKPVLRTEAALFDRLVAAVTEEHGREAKSRPDSSEERRAELVKRLLAGEPLDGTELAYDFEGCHLGAVAKGEGAAEAMRALAKAADRRLLAVRLGEETVWAWMGGVRQLDPEELERLGLEAWPAHLPLALGEPAQGLTGWRLTHQQAAAALPLALRGTESLIRYADVALLASILQDDLLATSLRELYLIPLERERDGGEALRQTLRAYFAAERNVSSAAAALGVKRHTVTSRLRTIEERLGRPLSTCASEIDTALRLDELEMPLHSRSVSASN